MLRYVEAAKLNGAAFRVDGCRACPMSIEKATGCSHYCQLAGVSFDEHDIPTIAPGWCPLRANNGVGVLIKLTAFCDDPAKETK